MKTPATPYRPLLLLFGAVAVVAVVAWNAETRSQATAGTATDPIATPTTEPAAAPMVAAAVPAAAAEAPPVQAPAPVPVESGMKAYLDPEGGLTHVPPQREAQPLASVPVRPERLPEVTLPDGSVKADLNGMFDEYSVMTIDENGNRVLRCVQHPDHLHGHAHPATPVEREDR